MRKCKLFMLLSLLALMRVHAQNNCVDWNGYVQSKNIGGTGYYNLNIGQEESAAQTYYFNGSARLTQLRVYGNYPYTGGVPLRISVYAVDVNGRPTTLLSSADQVFWSSDNSIGYITVSLPTGGIEVNSHFAVGVSVRNAWPYGTVFQLKYTGNGEGNGNDLASLSGTSTGNNWASAMSSFNRDGDFYLIPKMTYFLDAEHSVANKCLPTGGQIAIANTASIPVDSMFNRINHSGYTGAAHVFSWNFGDGSPVSYLNNPTHNYSSAGNYELSLTTTLVGWQMTCTESQSTSLSIGLTPQVLSTMPATCQGAATGSATVSASGGSGGYSYAIHNPSYQPSTLFSNLSAGSYTLSVRDNNNCVSTTPFSISEPSAIQFLNTQTAQTSCGNSTGSIQVQATGGTGSLQYQLNNGAFQSSGAFSNLSAGTYNITAKDASGCTKSVTLLVNSLNAPSFSILSQTNVTCHGASNGTLLLQGTGGAGQLQYSINGGSNFTTNTSYNNLTAGQYAVVVKDGANCRSGQIINITEPSEIAFEASGSSPTCFGNSNGSLQVLSAQGGTGNLTFSINNTNYQSNPVFQNIPAGNYTVYVKDIAGCVKQQTITLSQPSNLILNATITATNCFGQGNGALTINASGGVQPYQFSINNGLYYQPNQQFFDLNAGTYSLKVMDDHGCIGSTVVSLSQPSQVIGAATTTNSTCGNNNGGMLVTGSGGTGSAYQYSLDGITFNTTGLFTNLMAGNYYITIKDGLGCQSVIYKTIQDANGPVIGNVNHTDVSCNGGNDGTVTVNNVSGGTGLLQYSSNGITWNYSPVLTGLSAGNYTVYVKDANGCIGSTPVTLSQPNPLSVAVNTTPISCHFGTNGSATILAAGGAGSLAYSIDNGQTYQSSNVFSNLDAGIYTVIVRDFASCTADISFTLFEPTNMVVAGGVLNVSCHGESDGAITVYAYGGTGALTYSLDGVNYQSGALFNNLDGGFYTIYAKDANGCIKQHVEYVYEPQELLLNATLDNINCAGGDDGMINLNASGGTGIKIFDWSNGSTSEDLTGLQAGLYTVVVEDQNGCSASAAYQLTEPVEPIVVNASITNTTTNTGAIDATVTGGTAPYQFLWSTADITEDLDGLSPGTYTLTVTDNNGCVSSDVFIIENVSGITQNANTINIITIFPNPASEKVMITTQGEPWSMLRVRDAAGKVIFENYTYEPEKEISLTEWSAGVYYVELFVNMGIIREKLSIH